MTLRPSPWGSSPWGRAALLACAAVLLAGNVGAQPCDVPTAQIEDQPTLPRAYNTIRSGGSVTIVAIGGASTQGRAAGDDSKLSWPARAAAALTARFPGSTVQAVNLGSPRQTAEDMLKRIDSDPRLSQAALVIWETGTTEAVRGARPDDFRTTVQAGIDRLKARKIEVVLMDMQYSHRTLALYDLTEYRNALSEIADINDIPIFRRHDAMRDWQETGVFDFDVADPAQRRDVATRLYDCIGRGVAALIARNRSGSAVSPVKAPPEILP